MSSFTAPLVLTPCPATGWVTTRPFAYEIGKLGSGLVIEVPAGTFTDLGTIPRILWPVLPPHDPTCAAAFVLHDVLCRDREFSRLMADCVFYEAMRVLGVPRWRAATMFFGARVWALLKRR